MRHIFLFKLPIDFFYRILFVKLFAAESWYLKHEPNIA